jgi:hypothetical protein
VWNGQHHRCPNPLLHCRSFPIHFSARCRGCTLSLSLSLSLSLCPVFARVGFRLKSALLGVSRGETSTVGNGATDPPESCFLVLCRRRLAIHAPRNESFCPVAARRPYSKRGKSGYMDDSNEWEGGVHPNMYMDGVLEFLGSIKMIRSESIIDKDDPIRINHR